MNSFKDLATEIPNFKSSGHKYFQPSDPKSPFIFSVPHSGTRIPDHCQELKNLDRLVQLKDADLFVDDLIQEAVTQNGFPLLVCDTLRYVIDMNRAPDDVNDNDRGLVWKKTTDDQELQIKPLSDEEIKNRLVHYHQPYHQLLQSLLRLTKDKFGYAILIDWHSMPSKAAALHTDTKGEKRADIVPGTFHGKSCHPKLLDAINTYFSNQNYSVKPNQPYFGGYITQHYGQPSEELHAIQIETNRKLYMDEDQKTKLPDHFDSLKSTFSNFIDSLNDFSLV